MAGVTILCPTGLETRRLACFDWAWEAVRGRPTGGPYTHGDVDVDVDDTMGHLVLFLQLVSISRQQLPALTLEQAE